MIVVDSSVWIANLRNLDTEAVRKLESIYRPDEILVGDLILVEVLQGARDERHALSVERELRQFRVESMLDDQLIARVARNFRVLRGRGFTVRKTIDIIVGTFCVEHGHTLLHDDRDFGPMATHLGLKVA